MDKYSSIKLENQLCFPLYALSREVIKLYTPLLERFHLTYTQYVTMMVLWETEQITFRELALKLHLDSGTLTPVVKKLVVMELVKKARAVEDDRVVNLELTEKGRLLKDEILEVPFQLYATFKDHEETLLQLKKSLDEGLDIFTKELKG